MNYISLVWRGMHTTVWQHQTISWNFALARSGSLTLPSMYCLSVFRMFAPCTPNVYYDPCGTLPSGSSDAGRKEKTHQLAAGFLICWIGRALHGGMNMPWHQIPSSSKHEANRVSHTLDKSRRHESSNLLFWKCVLGDVYGLNKPCVSRYGNLESLSWVKRSYGTEPEKGWFTPRCFKHLKWNEMV